MSDDRVSSARDLLCFGPDLRTTSRRVKQSMLRDLDARDPEFRGTVLRVRELLLSLAGVRAEDGFEAVLVPGPVVFALESVLASAVPAQGKVLVVVQGESGERLSSLAQGAGIAVETLLSCSSGRALASAVDRALGSDPAITHVAAVHRERRTGRTLDVESIGRASRKHGNRLVLDSSAGFGALAVDLEVGAVDYLVSCSEQCLESVPGLSFVLARQDALQVCEGVSRSVGLDLYGRWRSLDGEGCRGSGGELAAQPLLALETALHELVAEGGVSARCSRYRQLQEVLRRGMSALPMELVNEASFEAQFVTRCALPSSAPALPILRDRLRALGFVVGEERGERPELSFTTMGCTSESDVRALLAALQYCLSASGGGFEDGGRSTA